MMHVFHEGSGRFGEPVHRLAVCRHGWRRLRAHRYEDEERFLLESKLLLCAHTDETDAGHTSLCILDENHNTRSEYASICLTCYDRLREKLARTEAALLIDLREAAQIVLRGGLGRSLAYGTKSD